jgi:HD-GYP domain-containing protein (c-di-GMP phosphodiesterase class II)
LLNSDNIEIDKLLKLISSYVGRFAEDYCIDPQDANRLFEFIFNNVKEFTQKQQLHISKLNEIGMALSAESNLDRLLEMILVQAKKFTNADGGTLYLMDKDEKHLGFKVVCTDSLNIKMGGMAGEIKWPPLRLFKDDGSQNREMVAALCAIDGALINIPDVYEATGFNFEGTKKFDEGTGYRSKSMLVIPMRNYENEVIGVVQLLNKIDTETNEAVAFTTDDELATHSLSSQAAVAITNAQLVFDLQNLLESVVKTIAVAVDEKSPYTGGHVRRVAELAMITARAISEADDGPYKNIHYSEDQLREIFMAAWMHDVGKVTTPEYVVDKSTKLETTHDRIEGVLARFEVVKRDLEISYLKNQLTKEEFDAAVVEMESDMEFVKVVNIGGEFMADDKIARVNKIASTKWSQNGEEKQLLSENEVKNLCIRKGTLTDEERQKINDHATVSFKMLSELPFPKKLRRIPEIAGAHHEKLNGKGYPQGLMADQISLEGRIMALADIFEALTAADRPYKKAKTLGESRKIISFMIKDSELDPDLVQFFYDKKLDIDYAKQELKPEQYEDELAEN